MKLEQLLTEEVKENIREAIQDNRIHWIEKDGKAIGFHTWEEYDGEIFINNLWIEEKHRNKSNLLSLRKYFGKMYPHKLFYWKNRKQNKEKEICLQSCYSD